MRVYEVSRDKLRVDFLKNYFKSAEFEAHPLPADASFRTYYRITYKSENFILMDSPLIYYSLAPFIKIAEFLLHHNFSAPEIYHTDPTNGFLLLEDFGSINIANYLLEQKDIQNKEQIYKEIIDLLVALQALTPPSNLEIYDKVILLKELELYTDWYLPLKSGRPVSPELKSEFLKLWEAPLAHLPNTASCLVLRDYHVENMMLLSKSGINSIGLLDFQDAVIGHPLYDVASVLEDARIDVPADFAYKFLDYYLQQTGIGKMEGYLSYHILGAQRNSRILGVFARKAIRDGQKNYLKYIPRVLNYLENDLKCEVLNPIKIWIEDNL